MKSFSKDALKHCLKFFKLCSPPPPTPDENLFGQGT